MSPHLLSGAARLAGSSLLRVQSDERLVALVRDGHDPAFTAVVDRYQPELARYCTRLVGESRAEDVVQQAFLNAHMALRSNDNPIQLRPWLYRIAHNAGLNVLRSSREQTELDDRLAAPGGLEQDVESRERLREALAAIARLPEPQRDALTLRAIEGRSHAEIAEALGVTAGAARQHLHRARSTVRAAVSALTPYGLIVRFAMADPEHGAAPIAATAGAGLSATVAKVGAGVLAAGALGVGATNLPILPTHHRHAPRAAVTRSAAVGEQAPGPAVSGAGAGDVSVPGADVSAGRHAGRGRGGEHGRGAAHGHAGGRGEQHGAVGSGRGDGSSQHSSGSGGGDSHGGDSHGGDSHSGSGDTPSTGSGDHQSGGGDSGSGSGDSSGSGGSTSSGDGSGDSSSSGTSGDSGSGSGSDSGSGSGSSDVTTTTPTSDGGSGGSGGTDGGSIGTDGGSSGGTDGTGDHVSTDTSGGDATPGDSSGSDG